MVKINLEKIIRIDPSYPIPRLVFAIEHYRKQLFTSLQKHSLHHPKNKKQTHLCVKGVLGTFEIRTAGSGEFRSMSVLKYSELRPRSMLEI